MDASESSDVKRSLFLKFIVFLMNAFLVVTAASAALALVDDLSIHSEMGSSFFSFRGQIDLLDVVLLLLAVVAIIVVPQLPKLVLLPPILVGVWQILGAPGMTWSILDRMSMAKLDGILLAAVAISFVVNMARGGSLFIRTADLPFRENLVTRTLVTMPLALIAIVVIGVAGILTAIPTYVEQQSRGYLHFAPQGLEVRDTTLVKGGHVVHLIGMVHIGDPEFYRSLYKSIPADALVLAEGVTDRDNRMATKPSYDNAARGLGLESQGEFQKLLAGSNRLDAPPAPTQPGAPVVPPPVNPLVPHVVFADIDVSDLSPSTLRFLEAVGTVFQAPNLTEAVQRYIAISQQFKEEEVKGVMDEILTKRNEHVVAAFDKYEPQYRLIYMPWGALHMPGIEDKIIARGYKVQSVRMMPIAKYDAIMNALTQSFGKEAAPPAPEPAAVPATTPAAPVPAPAPAH
jgi:hypothetical protein